MKGRAAGFNYAAVTLAWVSIPYAYYYIFAGTITDDEDQTHVSNVTSSLIWWVTLALLALASVTVAVYVPESSASKLAP
jgi:polyferredoxin